jgi:LPXTG-motif cell wall anchor domain protein
MNKKFQLASSLTLAGIVGLGSVQNVFAAESTPIVKQENSATATKTDATTPTTDKTATPDKATTTTDKAEAKSTDNYMDIVGKDVKAQPTKESEDAATVRKEIFGDKPQTTVQTSISTAPLKAPSAKPATDTTASTPTPAPAAPKKVQTSISTAPLKAPSAAPQKDEAKKTDTEQKNLYLTSDEQNFYVKTDDNVKALTVLFFNNKPATADKTSNVTNVKLFRNPKTGKLDYIFDHFRKEAEFVKDGFKFDEATGNITISKSIVQKGKVEVVVLRKAGGTLLEKLDKDATTIKSQKDNVKAKEVEKPVETIRESVYPTPNENLTDNPEPKAEPKELPKKPVEKPELKETPAPTPNLEKKEETPKVTETPEKAPEKKEDGGDKSKTPATPSETPQKQEVGKKETPKPTVGNKTLPKTGAEAIGMQFAGGLAALGLGGGTLFKRRKK